MWQWIGRGAVVFAGGVLALSFAGDLHPVGDSLAVFRPAIAVCCWGACATVWRWRGAQAVGVAAVIVALWHGVGGWFYPGPKERVDLTLYQKNMLFRATDRAPLDADIRASGGQGADVVTLQEVSPANLEMLGALSDLYPYQLVCEAYSVGAVAILSKTELTGETCGARSGFARAVTQVRGRNVQIISVHLHWPWPYGQHQHARDLAAALTPLAGGDTVIGGDFNMVASGRSLARFERATGTARVGPTVATFRLFGYPLGIDHVLATGGTGLPSVRPLLGSDHNGVVALIAFP